MEVLPYHHDRRLRYQIATAAVSSILFQNQENSAEDEPETAIDLSIKATTTLAETSTTLDSSLVVETSFSKAHSFHRNELSSPKKDQDTSSSEDEFVVASQIKRLLPDLHKHFELHSKVGEGTFASVYLASLRKNKEQKFAIKHVTPTCHPSRIKKEIQCLKEIGGADNVCGIHTCIRNKGNIAFILPYLRHDKFPEYVLEMDTAETKEYMKNMLIALKRVHQFNVIHRDVKPGNFLYDRECRKFLLVDFGLAQWMKPQKPPTEEKNLLVNVECRKRKSDVENEHSPSKKAMLSTFRPILKSQTCSTKNIIVQNQNGPKVTGPLFQMLAPPLSMPVPKQISINSKASFVRVKNSQVKMLNAPMQSTSSASHSASGDRSTKPKCPCYKKHQLCEVCLGRHKKLAAPRAGTPGYRPPEVLLKSLQQTTAVDIWAAGVVFLSILSGSYPFFRSPDDMTALAELVTLFGSKAISEVAMKLDRVFVCDKVCPPLDLQKLCSTLRANRLNPKADSDPSTIQTPLCNVCAPSLAPSCGQVTCFCPSTPKLVKDGFPPSAYDLLKKLLDPNPATRITAEQALQHTFLQLPASSSIE